MLIIPSGDKTQLLYRNDDRRCQYVRFILTFLFRPYMCAWTEETFLCDNNTIIWLGVAIFVWPADNF